MRRALIFIVIIFAAPALASPAKPQPQFDFSVVAQTSTPAPVPPELRATTAPAINNNGQVAFNADNAIFLKTGTSVISVAKPGDTAPGGGKFIFTGPLAINSRGQILFQAFVTSPSHSGLFLYANGKISRMERDAGPNFSGNVFIFESPAINDQRDIAFTADTGLFLKSKGVFSKIAAIGDPSPDGGTFTFFSGPSINHSRQVVFSALTSVGSGIFLSSGGTLTKIAAGGDPSPSGGSFSFFFFLPTPCSLNDAGQVAFTGNVSGGPSGIFLYSNGTLSNLLPTPAPLPNGDTLGTIFTPVLNNAGQVAFTGSTFNGSGTQIFISASGKLTQITETGQAAPGGDHFTAASSPALNDAGAVAFTGQLHDSNGGVFVFSPLNGGLTSKISGQGVPIPGTPRFTTMGTIGGFSKKGTVAMLASSFPGAGGIFTSSATGARLVAHQGDAAPGGGVLTQLFDLGINDRDQVVFDATTSFLDDELILKSGNALRKVARMGDPTPDGGSFSNFNAPSINNLGQIGFYSQPSFFLFSNGQITRLFNDSDLASDGSAIGFPFSSSLNNKGQVAFSSQRFPKPNAIVLFSQQAFTLIASDGDQAPGGGQFLLRPDSLSGPFISNHTDIVFAAGLSTGGTGIFRYSGGVLTRVAGPGDPAPGGSTFAALSDPSINNDGQIAFVGQTATGESNAYLYKGGQIVRVVGKGEVVFGTAKMTFVSSVKINSLGQVAVHGGLTTGNSAILIATPKQGPAEGN